MLDLVLWLAAVEVIGLAALPLVWWLLRALPDRGTAFAKPIGLLLVGYTIWLGSSLGVLANARATVVVWVVFLGGFAWAKFGRQFGRWLRAKWRTLLLGEVVFLCAFLAAALLRAHNPDIMGTEKPMDFAFFNASLRAERAPPEDPWLAGYGISYYYFGYFLMAMVAKLAAVPAAVGYNLSLALLFGLVAAGSYSLVYNLVAGRAGPGGERTAAAHGLLGPLLVGLLANLEGALEVLYNNNLLPSSFWHWLGIRDLLSPRQGPHWYPTDPPDTWWWWRASRVVGDFDPVTGVTRDYTINEFPFFSFLLGDLHPHVMALPFLLLALALALALLREREEISLAWLWRNRGRTALYVLSFGALGFLNSWDLPTSLFMLTLCYVGRRASAPKLLPRALLREALAFGALAVLLALMAYLPFYVFLRSQASGIGVVGVRTQVQHLIVFWGPLLVTAGAYPLVAWRPALSDRRSLLPWVGRALLVLIAMALVGAGTLGLLLLILLPAGMLLRQALFRVGAGARERAPEDLFALVLVLTGVLLVAVCEVFFVRDSFGNRMNTVFKLYYQAWVLLALAAAYTIYYFDLRRRVAGWRGGALAGYRVWRGAVVVLLACGLVYTALAPLSKTAPYVGRPTLDGLAWLRAANPYEYEAIAWLADVEGRPVILEASGGQYSHYNQASAFTGLPTVLGWAGHQYQWRGNTPEPAQRKADVDAVYQTTDVNVAERILRQYGVTYVYVGSAERQAYASAPASALVKFARFMDVAYRNDQVTIYRLRPAQAL